MAVIAQHAGSIICRKAFFANKAITRKDKVAKVATARTLWVPAVNYHGGFGRWAFIEIGDPWDAQNLIRGFLKQMKEDSSKDTAHG